ncbi:hypothetical protein [Microvirga lotononidis]|uniref:Uncharacterized protein n=1 Tax=Microvirga lotononidis TaxID=864069 RepID=I4YP66_9HYPH|nr:hypothetical protein [Microvirga lotononidis]EIM25758.1 hypothetical protein MicloDRAFT_00064850 [Microvirga lotononidis]WQO25686.1 hypothetical protein U0023_13260 [Microvirga lotononidis]
MQYQNLKFRLTGVSPLICHNGQLADPLNSIAKEMKKVSSKRAKTDADFEELARLEFFGGLYLDNGEPVIPGEIVEAALVEAARKQKKGQQAKAGILSVGNFPIEYEGPRTVNELWADDRFRLTVGVKVQRNKVMRTRPIFRDWSCEISIDFLPGQLNRSEVEEMVRTAGTVVGIGDWRPKFGRFMAQAV